jgi:O-antigen/teichoic acid export membrane protein
LVPGKVMMSNAFLRHMLTLLGGTAAGQMIALLAAPLLTRLYGPADFAGVAAFVGVSTILSIFATLRYDLALLLPQEEEDAGRVFQLSLLILVVATVLISLLLWLFGPLLVAAIPTFATVAHVLPLVPVMMLAIAGSQILSAWANRQRAYRGMAGASVLNQGGNVVISSLVGWTKVVGSGLLVGRLTGQLASVIWLAVCLRPGLPQLRFKLAGLTEVARRYRQFPFFNVPYSLLGALSQEFLVFALLAFHHVGIAGHFALVRTVLLLPARYLSSSLGLVFFREAAQLFGTPALEALTLKLMYRLGVVVAPFTAFFMFWSEEIFVLVFGESWRMAGQIAAWYAPVGFLFLFTSWPERLYEVSERQAVSLGIEIVGNITKVAAVLIPLWTGAGPIAAIVGYALADAVYHVAYLLGLFHVGRFPTTRLASLAGTLLLSAGICAAGCGLLLLAPLPVLAQAVGGAILASGIAAYGTIRQLQTRLSP